jgi:hypothetical protein
MYYIDSSGQFGQGYTAMMYASMVDKLELVQELLARGPER